MEFSDCERVFAMDALNMGVLLGIPVPGEGLVGANLGGLPLAPGGGRGVFWNRSPLRRVTNLNFSLPGAGPARPSLLPCGWGRVRRPGPAPPEPLRAGSERSRKLGGAPAARPPSREERWRRVATERGGGGEDLVCEQFVRGSPVKGPSGLVALAVPLGGPFQSGGCLSSRTPWRVLPNTPRFLQ